MFVQKQKQTKNDLTELSFEKEFQSKNGFKKKIGFFFTPKK